MSFGQRYCCLACEILDGLKSKEKKQGTSPTDLPSAEDHAIQSLFGIPEKGGYKYFCEVEPIACAACLFPLAQLPQYVDGLTDLRWDRHTNRLSFTLPQDRSSPTYVFQLLKKMGLAPRWYRINETANRSQPQSSSLRIGVTGALFGNIMLFAIPIYGGLSGELANIFFFIQGLLFLPVLFWSARPFYQGALVGLRTNTLSTDLPLSLAFLVGSIFSYVGLFLREKEWIYFDSLSGFIFLILLSRYLLERAVIKEETSIPIENFLETSVLPIFDEQNKDKPLAWKSIFQLKAGDIIGLEQQQRLPANGILLDSQAEFEHSWMTGEWEPETYGKNSPIPAGSRLLSSKAYLRLEQNPEESQFIKLLQSLKSTGQKISTQEESLIGQILVLGSFLGAVALAFIAPHLGTLEILRRSLALWIVACPCAVSFIAPLTRALGARLAYHLGFWIRDAGVFHKLPKVKTIAFDKTGTITQTLINIDQDAPLLDNWLKRVILSLESISCHPIARAFRATFGAMELLPVTNHREIIGQGVEGQIDGHHFQITKSAHNPQVIELKKNDKAVVSFSLKESIPHPLIQWLKNLSSRFNLYVISGDHPSRVEELTRLIEIP
ncbi:MAG: HAD-IC family P-type ATPase, partial [Pseudobdellovibrionaceae bacterium]|nr:HAD-IC family P-type ATPase [Pseudobdellovibrionaceae bacterium]